MKTWTLLLCEGAHDQAALLGWLCASGWNQQRGAPSSLPETMQKGYPKPKDVGGKVRTEKAPDYVHRQDAWIEIRSLGGVTNVLGDAARIYLDVVKDDIHGVGFFVDADDLGFAMRQQAFREAFRTMFAHAVRVHSGEAVDGPPKLGLWVAPDNRRLGTLSELLVESFRLATPAILSAAETFATSVEQQLGNMASEKRLKLVLGTAGQVDAPSEALSSALRQGTWAKPGYGSIAAVQEMIAFIERLVA